MHEHCADWAILANVTQNVQTGLDLSREVFSIFPIIDTIADGTLGRNNHGIRLQFLQYAFVVLVVLFTVINIYIQPWKRFRDHS